VFRHNARVIFKGAASASFYLIPIDFYNPDTLLSSDPQFRKSPNSPKNREKNNITLVRSNRGGFPVPGLRIWIQEDVGQLQLSPSVNRKIRLDGKCGRSGVHGHVQIVSIEAKRQQRINLFSMRWQKERNWR